MLCPECGYMMDAFDKDCERCHGQGLQKKTASPDSPAKTQQLTANTVVLDDSTLPPTQSGWQEVSPQFPSSPVNFIDEPQGPNGIQIAGGLLLLVGLLWAGYYFAIFDVSVEVPTGSFMGYEYGGGRVNNIGLMAQRQNGILIGMGVAVIGAILFGIGYSQQGSAASYSRTPQPQQSQQPQASNGDLTALYILSALLPIGGIVLCLVNANKPERAQAAAIGTVIGTICGILLFLVIK